ncbi:MAG: hypothetical protein AAF236_02980 [Verrucomicrobiota bacterium]
MEKTGSELRDELRTVKARLQQFEAGHKEKRQEHFFDSIRAILANLGRVTLAGAVVSGGFSVMIPNLRFWILDLLYKLLSLPFTEKKTMEPLKQDEMMIGGIIVISGLLFFLTLAYMDHSYKERNKLITSGRAESLSADKFTAFLFSITLFFVAVGVFIIAYYIIWGAR